MPCEHSGLHSAVLLVWNGKRIGVGVKLMYGKKRIVYLKFLPVNGTTCSGSRVLQHLLLFQRLASHLSIFRPFKCEWIMANASESSGLFPAPSKSHQ